MVMVTGFGPQLNVMMPPRATALTTAAEVQLAGVPVPMTWSGWLVFTAAPARGTLAWPSGFPKSGRRWAAAWAGPGVPTALPAVVLAEAVAAASPVTVSAAPAETAPKTTRG